MSMTPEPCGRTSCLHIKAERDELKAQVSKLGAERDEAFSTVRELRRKLAIAGVEGSPPPSGQTTIGALFERTQKAEAEAAVLRQALESVVLRWQEGNPDNIPPYAEGEWGTDDVRAEDVHRLRATLASGAGKALLDELESLRKRVAELECELAGSESALHLFVDQLRDAGGDSVEGLHDAALAATERAEKAEAALADAEDFKVSYETLLAERDSLKAQLAASEGHVIALREALEHEKKRADAEANDTFCSCNMQGEPCDDCFRLGMRIAHLGRALASPSPQPTHWVPREQVTKLVAALRGLRDAVSMRLARGEDTTPGDFERAWRAACDALDARKGGG